MIISCMMFFKVLLFCLVTFGHGRPSTDTEEQDEYIREAKKEKYFQHDSGVEQTETPTTENVMNRLKSIAHLRMADAKTSSPVTITREELEALKDILDKNLQKYQNYNEYSYRKRPNDPYIGQILQNLNYRQPDGNHDYGNNNNNNNHNHNYHDNKVSVESHQMPIRRKIIRHTVFTTPLNGGGNFNRLQGGGGDPASRIEWTSPWADYFPILIKDPFQSMMNSFSEIIEYGPAADICRHAHSGNGGGADDEDANRLDGGARETRVLHDDDDDSGTGPATAFRPDALKRSRRNTAGTAAVEEEKGVLNHVRPHFKPHASSTSTEMPKHYWAPDKQATEHNGDTGPQIKRLVVRRGGVAIAGPGGIATAGSGGTAIVGPGGSAYSSKDTASGATADVPVSPGVSMAGYGPHVVQGPPNYFAGYPQQHNGFGRSADGGTAVLSSDGVAYTFPVPSRGLTTVGRSAANRRDTPDDGGNGQRPLAASIAQEISLPDGAKLIATGPIVYYNPEPSSSITVRKRTRKGKKPTSSSAETNAKRRDYDDYGSF